MTRVGLLFSLCLALVVATPALADAPPATTTTTEQTVPDGVVLGGLAIGGLSVDDAVAAVTQQFSRPVVLRIHGRTVTISPAALGVKIYASSGVAAALAAQPDASLGLRAGVDRTRVRAYVKQLAARLDHKASSSRLLLRNARPLVTPSLAGLEIEQGPATAMLTDELVHGTRAPIAVPAKVIQPQTSESTIGPVIVIRRGSNLLTLYRGDKYVRQFHVATGQAIYPTPLGQFHIVVKWKDPTWYPPTQDAWAKGLKPVPPGPDNPLGTRWMGIDSPGVGIHGTDEPASIGYSESHGCIRMLVPDAEWLFDHVTVGTPVFIVPA
ncbi:MAG TPA: L,D-transpeptidase [Gaiellaceae bacterium]|nr:L,D-transpeptidase [Gaiellaceae bacterium]